MDGIWLSLVKQLGQTVLFARLSILIFPLPYIELIERLLTVFYVFGVVISLVGSGFLFGVSYPFHLAAKFQRFSQFRTCTVQEASESDVGSCSTLCGRCHVPLHRSYFRFRFRRRNRVRSCVSFVLIPGNWSPFSLLQPTSYCLRYLHVLCAILVHAQLHSIRTRYGQTDFRDLASLFSVTSVFVFRIFACVYCRMYGELQQCEIERTFFPLILRFSIG